METALERHGRDACAVVVEPLAQCLGAIRMHEPAYLTLLCEACDRHAVHPTADEIALGSGRTDTLFAREQAPITQDFLSLSKGLTGGHLPLSVLLTSDAVY